VRAVLVSSWLSLTTMILHTYLDDMMHGSIRCCHARNEGTTYPNVPPNPGDTTDRDIHGGRICPAGASQLVDGSVASNNEQGHAFATNVDPHGQLVRVAVACALALSVRRRATRTTSTYGSIRSGVLSVRAYSYRIAFLLARAGAPRHTICYCSNSASSTTSTVATAQRRRLSKDLRSESSNPPDFGDGGTWASNSPDLDMEGLGQSA
jgi:hypothetical protein